MTRDEDLWYRNKVRYKETKMRRNITHTDQRSDSTDADKENDQNNNKVC